jgi:hypothetical protein
MKKDAINAKEVKTMKKDAVNTKEVKETQENAKDANKGGNGDAAAARVRYNIADLKSAYANVCNVTSTQEEVVLNFGINQEWERGQQKELEIQLKNRIILNPFVAKRLSIMLSKLCGEYEGRYGELKLEPPAAAPSTAVQQ